MATHVRMTEWAARLVGQAIDKIIPDEESVQWDVGVVPTDPLKPSNPSLVIWLAIDGPEHGIVMESTYSIDLYDLSVETVMDHIRKTWDVCLVERMEVEFSLPD